MSEVIRGKTAADLKRDDVRQAARKRKGLLGRLTETTCPRCLKMRERLFGRKK